MNGIKKFLLVFAALLFVFVTSCTGANTNHSHAYTDWVIEEQPPFSQVEGCSDFVQTSSSDKIGNLTIKCSPQLQYFFANPSVVAVGCSSITQSVYA